MSALNLVKNSQEIIEITRAITLIIDYAEGFAPAGILRFANGNEITFNYTEAARLLFNDLDNADPLELIYVLGTAGSGF